jgi:hypothetical protein
MTNSNSVEAPPAKGYIGEVPGSRIAGGRPVADVRSRFREKGEDAATCANGARARHTLGAQSRGRRGESDALPG